MKCINLFGAPGSGKSTIAAELFSKLKKHHIKTELVGEFAKELIYLGNETQLVNQVYVMGSQYRKMKDLQRYGIDIAVSDGPLMLQAVYCANTTYRDEIVPLIKKLDSEFTNINIYIKRVAPYQTYGRVHDEAQSDKLAKEIWDSMEGNFHYVINGNDDGAEYLTKEIIRLHDKDLLDSFWHKG